MPTPRIDVLDLASENDLLRIERIMSLHPDYKIETIYSPYILLAYQCKDGAARVEYFERQSEKDMKIAEEIMNTCEILHQDFNVRFPFAKMTWTE